MILKKERNGNIDWRSLETKITNIVLENLNEIPKPCRNCIYWEFPEDFNKIKNQEAFKRKKEWFKKTLKVFGSCGKLVYVDHKPIAYSQYAPPKLLPQTENYGSKTLDLKEKTVFISCLFVVSPQYRRRGIGTKLLREIISELKERGFKVIETFARKYSENNPSGPMKLFLKQGFYIKEEINSEYVLVRLEI